MESFEITLPVSIRPAYEEDLPTLYAMGGEFWQASVRDGYRRSVRGEVVFLVAAVDDFPVGAVWVDFRGDRGELRSFGILQPLRGRGIGGRLVEAAETILRSRGVRTAWLALARGNKDSQRLYRRLGYSVVGTERREDEDCYVLQKAL